MYFVLFFGSLTLHALSYFGRFSISSEGRRKALVSIVGHIITGGVRVHYPIPYLDIRNEHERPSSIIETFLNIQHTPTPLPMPH